MKCSKCNAEIADDAKFCPVCGAKVEPESKCPNCGEKLEDGAKFCTKCGTKIDNCNEGKENLSSTSENPVTEATKSTIVKHDEESSAINASRPLPTTNSSSMAVKKNKSVKKAVIIIAFVFVAVIIAWSVEILVQHFVNKSNYQGNSYNYGYSSDNNLSNTYSNEYISFRYPSNYKIADVEKDENGEISFNCEIKGDNLSCITIASGEDAGLAYAYEQEIKELSIETINTINSTLMTMYYDIKFSTISKKTVGNCKGYFCDFTAKAFSETVKGYTFVGVSVNYYVTILTQAENDKYMRQLDEILSTLDVKAEALEGEWSTIR